MPGKRRPPTHPKRSIRQPQYRRQTGPAAPLQCSAKEQCGLLMTTAAALPAAIERGESVPQP